MQIGKSLGYSKKDIFEDAETLRFKGKNLIEIGNKITDIKEVQDNLWDFLYPKK